MSPSPTFVSLKKRLKVQTLSPKATATLPFTGEDVGLVLAVASMLLGGGLLLHSMSRTRPTPIRGG
jgi:hypothetical protein